MLVLLLRILAQQTCVINDIFTTVMRVVALDWLFLLFLLPFSLSLVVALVLLIVECV